jgi:nitrite reductase (NADH) large subunit
MAGTTPLWRCSLCGYVHEGALAPDSCPVCGAAQADFEPYDAAAATAVKAGNGRWQCQVCHAIVTGEAPPLHCPVCGAAREDFEPAGMPAERVGGRARVVVVGAGIAGVSAAESVRQAAPDSSVTLVSRENVLPYYRLNLTRYLAGDIGVGELPIHPDGWYARNSITLECNTEVSHVDLTGSSVVTAAGRGLPFDRLILAVGAHPFMPPLEGKDLPGVFAVRTSQDAEALLQAVQRGGPVVCIGGGVLGLETAGALARHGVDVTLLESHEWLMPRQLNRRAAQRLERAIRGMGIQLIREARTAALTGEAGAVNGVRLVDGTLLRATTVVITTGVRPNTALARRMGLDVGTGIIVDSRLRTSHPSVYAAGDVAEHNGVLYGLWGASLAQGTIAGFNAAGADIPFLGMPRASALKVLGLDVVSIGQFQAQDGSWVALDSEDDETYRHFVFHDGILVGAILMGDGALGPAVRKAVESRQSFTALLRRNASAGDIVAALG